MAASGRIRSSTLAVIALCSVQFVDVLGVTVVVTTLPGMLTGLRAPASSGSLVSGGYAMFFGGLLMLGARLGDRFGHRRTRPAHDQWRPSDPPWRQDHIARASAPGPACEPTCGSQNPGTLK